MDKKYVVIGGAVFVIFLIWIFIPKGHKPKADSEIPAPSAQEIYTKASQLKRNRDLPEAKQVYQEILKDHPDFEKIDVVQKELEQINMDIIFSNVTIPDKTVIHEVAGGDTLGKLAKKYNTTVDLIKQANNLKSDVIRLGQKLRVWTGNFNIFVDKSQNVLILKEGNEVVKVYDVSTGENNSTPVGKFQITEKLVDPVWFNRGVIVPPESPQNELGSRWMGFDIPGYGIHGTLKPETVGQQVTAGCVRMRKEDVEELYTMVPRGTEVVIQD